MRTRILRWIGDRLRGAESDSLTVLNFHGVVAEPLPVPDLGFMSQGAFLGHLETICSLYRVVPLREGIEAASRGEAGGPWAAITFDDGFADFSQVVYPILDDFGIPAACFLVTGLVGTEDTLWYCRLHKAISETARSSFEWRGTSFDLASVGHRARASVLLQGVLKELPPSELRAAVQEISRAISVDPDEPIGPRSPYRILGEADVRRLATSDLIEFGPHTRSHSILSLLSPEEQREEIANSVGAVRAWTGRPADLFAYPNGRKADYDEASLAALREAGVRAAVTTVRGRCARNTPPLEIPRLWIGEETRAREIAP